MKSISKVEHCQDSLKSISGRICKALGLGRCTKQWLPLHASPQLVQAFSRTLRASKESRHNPRSWARHGGSEGQVRGRAACPTYIPSVLPFRGPSRSKSVVSGIVMDPPASTFPAPTNPRMGGIVPAVQDPFLLQ